MTARGRPKKSDRNADAARRGRMAATVPGPRPGAARGCRAPTRCWCCPTAAAFEHPARVVERATSWFESLGARVAGLEVVNRRDAEDDANVAAGRATRAFIYLADGSPLHLRSVLKGSALYDALVRAYNSGAVIAASGAGATVFCDPMVDPRGGAYTVGLGLVPRPGRVPVPRHARPTTCANGRSSCCPRTRCSSGSTSTPRSCATPRAAGASTAPAPRPSTARATKPTVLRIGELRRRRAGALALGDRRP